jgi:membrane associated rhomboid family serine protease
MRKGTRLLLAIALGAIVGIVLGAAAGLLASEGMRPASTVLAGASGAISAGLVVVLLRPRPRA